MFPFHEDLRSKLIDYIDGYIRRLAASYPGAKQADSKSLKELALDIPDSEWSEKMTRAHRIFPKTISEHIHQWAFENVGKPMGRSRSAVNVVYPAEVKTNPSLDYTDLAIYWRCVRPGKPDAGRAHRDSGFWELEHKNGFDPKIPFPYHYIKDSIKIWMPLTGCTPKTTLQIIPCSHVMEIETLKRTLSMAVALLLAIAGCMRMRKTSCPRKNSPKDLVSRSI